MQGDSKKVPHVEVNVEIKMTWEWIWLPCWPDEVIWGLRTSEAWFNEKVNLSPPKKNHPILSRAHESS